MSTTEETTVKNEEISNHAQATTEAAAQLKKDAAKVVSEGKAFLGEAAREGLRTSSEKGREAYEHGLETAQKGYEAVRTTATDLGEQTSERVRKHPLKAIGLSLGAGLVLGALVACGTRRSS